MKRYHYYVSYVAQPTINGLQFGYAEISHNGPIETWQQVEDLKTWVARKDNHTGPVTLLGFSLMRTEDVPVEAEAQAR